MTHSKKAYRFRQNCVAAAVSMLLAPSAFALQNLSDERLAETTGEGVALLPENFKMVFQGPNDISAASSYGTLTDKASLLEASKKDTGFIRIIPAGGNYEKLYEQNRQKIYNDKFNADYTYKLQDNYNQHYLPKYNQVYSSVKNNADYRAQIRALYAKDFDADYAKYSTDNAAQISTQTTQLRPTAPWVSRYTELYNQRREDTVIGAAGCTWCAHTESDSASKAWAENAVAGEIKNYIISTAVNANIDQRTNTRLEESAALKAKNEADAYYETYRQQLYNGARDSAQSLVSSTNLAESLKASRTKADVFIYGLALSKSNDDMSQRYSNQGLNWGSAENPWLFRSGTAKDIQQFKKENKADIAYLALEAPLAREGGNSASDRIKLGFWTDIFSRSLDSSSQVDPVTGAPVSGLDKDYRLRAQFVANGLSIDGSQVRLFQTQPSSVAQHNQTLGMASVLRLNTHDDPSKLSMNDADLNARGIRLSTAARTDNDDGAAPTPAMDGSFAPIFNESDGLYLYSANINLVLGNMYQPFVLGSEGGNIILELTRIPNVPEIYTKIYSYYADTDGANPLVKTREGASAVQPQLKDSDGIYRVLEGSTCNVSACGSNTSEIKAGSATLKYQGSNATHSSIAIGSVTRDPLNNTLKANRAADSTGVVFRGPASGSAPVNLGSAAIDGVLIQHFKIKTTGL